MIQTEFSRPMKDRKRKIVTHSSALKSEWPLLNFRVSERKTESENGRKKEGVSKQRSGTVTWIQSRWQWIGFSQPKKTKKERGSIEKMQTEISILKRFEQIKLPAKLLTATYRVQKATLHMDKCGSSRISACYQEHVKIDRDLATENALGRWT